MMFAADLPRPSRSWLSLYVLGPGVGESQVVVFPDGRVLVVDACTHDGKNLARELLSHLGIRSIDLLVLTHPDLDHVRGIAELIDHFTPGKIWRYPKFSCLRDLVLLWCRQAPANKVCGASRGRRAHRFARENSEHTVEFPFLATP